MTWGKVDDSLHSHPKALKAGVEAMGLWVLALSHCCAYLTDGFISSEVLIRFCTNKWQYSRSTLALLRAELWVEVDGGFQFKDWSDYQPTKAQVLEERAKKSAAGRRGGRASGEARASTLLQEETNSRPVPSRPVPKEREIEIERGTASPSHPTEEAVSGVRLRAAMPVELADDSETTKPAKRSAKATRIAATWQPSPEDVEKTVAKGIDPQASREAFVDYWLAASGPSASKLDWDAAFRTWVRKSKDYGNAPAYVAPPKPIPPPRDTLAAHGIKVVERTPEELASLDYEGLFAGLGKLG